MNYDCQVYTGGHSPFKVKLPKIHAFLLKWAASIDLLTNDLSPYASLTTNIQLSRKQTPICTDYQSPVTQAMFRVPF